MAVPSGPISGGILQKKNKEIYEERSSGRSLYACSLGWRNSRGDLPMKRIKANALLDNASGRHP
jgi:hypothetical protein